MEAVVESRLVAKPDIALRYRVSPRTVDNWLVRGLPCRKIGRKMVRFDPRETDQWLEKFKRGDVE
jgi:phage terminase Nu1 subunit (DNA packaging protein)